MKTICIESGDGLGKNTLIKGLCEHFSYDNVTVRHLGKPPKKFPEDITPFEFQQRCFWKEGQLIEQLEYMDRDAYYSYFENILIFNRFIWGEYVYGQMYRKVDPKTIQQFIQNFETDFLFRDNTHLVLLTADPEFFLAQEDGNSFSDDIKKKTKELQLFEEAFDGSNIISKMKIKVNIGSEYRDKFDILRTVLEMVK